MWNCLGRLLKIMNQEQEDIFSDFTKELWTTNGSPPLLYHYTNIEGARSIISNEKKLWASSFETMNDNKELRHGLGMAKGDIPIFLKQIAIDELLKGLTSNWESFLADEIKNPKMRPYILCFTESHESKLHWERYADSSRGVVLEFKNTFALKNSANGFLVKVIYDEIIAREKFRLNLKSVTELFIQDYKLTPNITEKIAHKKLCDLFNAYLQIMFNFSLSLKESEWAGEQEWRLVAFGVAGVSPQSTHGSIQYRTRQPELVDYLVVDTKICGYQLSGAKKGCYFPTNSSNGFSYFLNLHSVATIV